MVSYGGAGSLVTVDTSSAQGSFTHEHTAIGNAVFATVIISSDTITVSGISDPGATWSRVAGPVNLSSHQEEIWMGVVTATGPQTATVTYSAPIGSTHVVLYAQEFASSNARNAQWTGDASAVSTATGLYPSLSPTSGRTELYIGVASSGGVVNPGSTPDCTYVPNSNGDLLCYSVRVTAPIQPNNDGGTRSLAALVYDAYTVPETPPPPSQPVDTGPIPARTESTDWMLWMANTVTGQVVGTLDLDSVPSWARELGPGTLDQVTVRYPDDGDMRQRLREPYRWSVALARGQWVAQMGVYVKAEPDETGATVALSTMTLWDFLGKKRLLVGNGDIDDPANDVVFGPDSTDPANKTLSLAGIARRLVQIGITYDGDSRWNLPITFPDQDFTGDAVRHYASADLAYVGDRLAELTQVDGGPEVEFSPEFTDTTRSYLRWRMRVADRLTQPGEPHAWDQHRALQTFTVVLDGADMSFFAYAKGQDDRQDDGSGSLTWAYALDSSYPDVGWPWLMTADTEHTSVTEQATIQGYATADVTTHQTPAYTASCVVRLDGLDNRGRQTGSPDISRVSPGDLGMAGIASHPWIDRGQYGVRVLRIEGQDADTARLTLQVLGEVS